MTCRTARTDSAPLAPGQEAMAVELQRMPLLPLDDLLVVVREFINPAASRSGLDRCLCRHGVSNLRELQARACADARRGRGPDQDLQRL